MRYRTSIIVYEVVASVFMSESVCSFTLLPFSDFGITPVYAFCLNLRFQTSIQDNALLENENNFFL